MTKQRIVTILVYADIARAHDFLVHTFGFDSGGVNRDAEGQVSHAEQAEQFAEHLTSGAGLHRGHPVLMLRNRLLGSQRDQYSTPAIRLGGDTICQMQM